MRGPPRGVPVLLGRDRVDRLHEVIRAELVIAVVAQVNAVPAGRVHVMLQRRRSKVRVHQVTRVRVRLHDPLRELPRVRDRRGQERVSHRGRQHRDGFFPDDSSLWIAHVMNLVEDHPPHLAHDLAALVQHRPQNLGRHHEARRVRVDRRVPGHQPHVRELVAEFSKFLIRQRLERGRVHDPLAIPQRHRDRVLRDDGLPRGRVRGDHHALVSLEDRDGGFLERVEDERVRLGARAVVRRVVQSVAVAVPALRDRDLVHARRPRRRRSHRRGVFGTFFLAAAADVVVSVVVVALALPRRLANRVRARV
mmetsp:Transcript_8366/g.30590  ORF Transcript_8366/g.30590 Transcript_8366/m.30590 type:complete len:308 (-) Transcript_8366:92-1015(-)